MDIEEEVDPNKMIVDSPLSDAAASEEEEARQAIDMLRGDDVSGRVAAANRLEAVAAALGEERTRDVCNADILKIMAVRVSFVLFTRIPLVLFTLDTGTAAILDGWSG